MLRKYLIYIALFVFFTNAMPFQISASTKDQYTEYTHETYPENKKYSGMLYAAIPDSEVKIFLPLKKTDVHLDITAGIVSANVTQQFKNDTLYPLEAVYIFPLPEQATITDMTLHIGDRTAFPNLCPDVIHDRPLQVVAEFPSGFSGEMILSGNMDGKPVTYSYTIGKSRRRHYPAIDKMYGRAIINDLMYKLLRADNDKERHTIQQEVIQTAIYHSLVSKFTSRVAVEERIVKQPDQSLVSVKVPVHLPKGWNPARFYPTATDSMIQFIIGSLIFFLGFFTIILRTTLKNWNQYEYSR